MTVSELFKKFRCCKPAPVLPTTQIQTTSYTYQLAFVQWALEYVLSITEGYEERTAELETRATSCERAITQLQEGIDPILVDIEDLDDRVTALEQGGGGGGGLSPSDFHFSGQSAGGVTVVEALQISGDSTQYVWKQPAAPSYLKAISFGEDADTNPYVFTGLTSEIADPTGKLTLSNGKIVVGTDVTVVGIAASVAVVSTRSNTFYEARLLKNNVSVASLGRTTASVTTATETFEIPFMIFAVNPGDEFTIGLSGGNGEACNVRVNVIKVK